MTHRSLIVFAKLPRAGEVKTRLGQSIGMKEAAEVYKRFAEHAFTLADELQSGGVSVYVFYAPGASAEEIRSWVGRPFTFIQQEGATLGERMKSAFERTIQDGFEQTVIIGTDVPELDAPVIHSAFQSLFSSDVILGPSTDGGYYLLGMKPPAKNMFEGIDWSTEYVFQQTIDKVKTLHLSFATLGELADVDTIEDYKSYVARRDSA